jgi:PAS domain S-box-containing protein
LTWQSNRWSDIEMGFFASPWSYLNPRPATLKSHLLKLILVGVLPLLVFSIGMVTLLARQERAAMERGLVETTRALTVALDKEFESSITALRGLASSEHLGIGDDIGFYDVCLRVLKSQPEWKKIIFLDAAAKPLFSTANMPGLGVAAAIERETLDVVLRTGKAAVSNLFNAGTNDASVSIYVPVLRAYKVKFVIAAVLEPEAFSDILKRQKISAAWVGTIIDRNRTIVARSRNQENFIGKSAGAQPRRSYDRVAEGWLEGPVRPDGERSYVAYSQSSSTGWSVTLTVPAAEVNALYYRSLLSMGGAGIVFLSAGLLVALIFAQRVSAPVKELSAMADALGNGRPLPNPAAAGLIEIDALAEDLKLAAKLLEQRSHERDKVEATLREKEESLQRHADLMQLTGEAIFGWEIDGSVIYWNRGAENLYKIPSGEAIGRSSHEVLSRLFPDIASDIKPMLKNSGEWIGEVKHVAEDGRQLTVERHVHLVRERNGRRLVLESDRDITSRKRFVQRLSTEHAVTRILSESATMSEAMGRILQAIGEGLEWEIGRLWLVSETKQLLECRETWRVTSKQSLASVQPAPLLRGVSLPGKVWSTEEPLWLGNVAEASDFDPECFALAENLRSAFAFPIKLHNDILGVIEFFSGEIREPEEDLLKTVSAMGDEIGQFVERMRTEAALRDSEDHLRRQAQELEQQLVASGRLVAIGELTASMAHEFNNPLGIIIGFAQGLLDDVNPDDPNYHHIEIIAEEAQRCEKIIQELLEFGRPKNTDIVAVDVKEVIDKTLELVSSLAAKSNVETTTQVATGLPLVHGDPQQLQQVLLNLSLNAVDAMPQGGTLSVGAGVEPAQQLVITVRDTGYGIDPVMLTKIFQPFFTAKKRRGLGLGLPICDRIVKAHGGKISVASVLGQGTIFKIHLPLHRTTDEKGALVDICSDS